MSFFENKETISVLNAIGENIFVADTNFDIIWINDYTEKMIGNLSEFIPVQSKDDLIGKNMRMFHENNGEKQARILTEGPFPYESKINLFGCYTANIVVNQLIIDEKLKGYVVTWKDVTNYEKRLTTIKDALDQSMYVTVVDKAGNITFVNDKFCDLSKYNKDELIGQSHCLLHPDAYYPESFYEDIIETIKKDSMWQGEVKQKAKDGTEFWVDMTIIPFVEKSSPDFYATIQQDITYRKEAEELLRRSEQLSVLGELAAGVAHEIRNPLTAIKGFTQLSSSSDPYKKIMLDEIERINMIVNEFMMLAKPHEVEYAPKNIVLIIKHVIRFLESESNLKNVFFRLFSSEEVFVNCEENQLKQVFINIMKNAIEAMPNGGYVDICVAKENEQVQISIKDEGVGLAGSEIKKLGEPFYSLKKDGNGLGLMMSFRIIENHYGKYQIESKVNEGTKITITFPIYKEDL
ncbi:PAS domain-containing sensor histidine kinase [Salipaludibacillus keqinensis]|uniref:histidine kinase n=1 Tax=Salipaludibacillus keqinensis TaxID=2045207 RepID=A0A323T8W8_9BACI|nr:PAS domain-containing sensor histidine kinase [Salipaludibacillus keqinensis]PYZ92148.1 PAS domain-containing sensor histidine kinase [Salipaludibacillus keqinensis]